MKCAIVLVFVGVLVFALGEALQSGYKNGISPHIIGGDQVNPLTRPYTIKLLLSKSNEVLGYCGGARLSQQWFITAAECFDENKYNEIHFLYPANIAPPAKAAGQYDSKVYNFNKLRYHVHPDYNNVTKANNIALFMCNDRLAEPEYFAKLNLPKRSEKDATFAGTTAIVSGWAFGTRTDGERDMVVTSYTTSVVAPFFCKLAYLFRTVNDEHICASAVGGMRITKDDVGVPLVVEEGGKNLRNFKLIGIGSSIEPWLSSQAVPSVFTKIAPHLEWISEKTRIVLRD